MGGGEKLKLRKLQFYGQFLVVCKTRIIFFYHDGTARLQQIEKRQDSFKQIVKPLVIIATFEITKAAACVNN